MSVGAGERPMRLESLTDGVSGCLQLDRRLGYSAAA
jgi:hypothetical protein